MRRRIRLTGRKQLPRSSAAVRINALPDGRRLLSLTINEQDKFKDFPQDARLIVRLYENQLVELFEFGTIGNPKVTNDLTNSSFVAPVAELRVAATAEKHGLLLGSTDSLSVNSENDPQNKARKGILLFLPADTAPRAWKLDLRPDNHPVVYVDKKIANTAHWARTDPVFTSTVLPTVIERIFEYIFDEYEPGDEIEEEWMKDWMRWSDLICGGLEPLTAEATPSDIRQWIDRVVDSFAQKMHLLDNLLIHVNKPSEERGAA